MKTRSGIALVVGGLLTMIVASLSQSPVPGQTTMPASGVDAPAFVQLTHSMEDHDYPAIAQSADFVYVAYVRFLHSDRAAEQRTKFDKAPASFEYLARETGGDQVFLLTYSKSKRTWSEPVSVSAAKQDVLRTAVAVDGKGQVWVFWAANKSGNFDIYARPQQSGKWGAETRITTDVGTDLNPVATTDTKGHVWVAWQGFRNRNLEILTAVQQDAGFTKEQIVSFSPRSDWDPSIAAAPNGEVAIAWDTYDKGDYDVYFRRVRMDGGIRMEAPVPVVASQNFEARASIAYDRSSRLWVAYEASAAKWGKDFGAYESTGVALYQDHTLQVKCFQGTQPMAVPGDLRQLIGGGAPANAKRKAVIQPDPGLASRRPANAVTGNPNLPLISFPRIAADPSGAIYLLYRKPLTGRSDMGNAWNQQMIAFDGTGWQTPVDLPASLNYVDVRPAVASVSEGTMLAITITDHRRMMPPLATKEEKQKQAAKEEADGLPKGIHNDLYAVEWGVKANPTNDALKPETAQMPAPPDADALREREQIKVMRDTRTTVGGKTLQLMRGEFHRHTELSGHGRDGPLIDAYRYMIDAASMDWGGCCDHDNGQGREYPWWTVQKLTDAYHLDSSYVPMFVYERSVAYPEGHRNVVFPRRGIRPLPRLPVTQPDSPTAPAPDTQMLYRYVRGFGGVVASHTSGTDMGTDWRDNDPQLEPVVEIYQGDRQNYEMPGAPRTNTAEDSIGGWRPLGFISLALKMGYRLGFQASSDHTSTHMSYCNLWVTSPTREGIMEAFRKRRVYGATDNILADVSCGSHFMGEEFSVTAPPAISVKLQGMAAFAKVHIIKDGEYVYSISPNAKNVAFEWKDTAAQKGKTSYYYVRGEQSDGELVWASPMWITYR